MNNEYEITWENVDIPTELYNILSNQIKNDSEIDLTGLTNLIKDSIGDVSVELTDDYELVVNYTINEILLEDILSEYTTYLNMKDMLKPNNIDILNEYMNFKRGKIDENTS